MYTFKSNSLERRSAQTAMFEILTSLLRIMAPILSMTADEAWSHVKLNGKKASIHLESWPRDNYEAFFNKELNEKWTRLTNLREAVLKRLEDKRKAGEIGSSLEAMVVLSSKDAGYKKFLADNKDVLRYLFIVSLVELKDEPLKNGEQDEAAAVVIHIDKAPGTKCQRCWNYSEQVGKDVSHPTLCERCIKAV